MLGWLGLTSRTFLPRYILAAFWSAMAWALTIFSMFAVYPYLLLTTTQGESTSLFETLTESTSTCPAFTRVSFHHLTKGLWCCLTCFCFLFSSSVSSTVRSSLAAFWNFTSENSTRYCIRYSSSGSVK